MKIKQSLFFLISPFTAFLMVEILQFGGNSSLYSPFSPTLWVNICFYYSFFMLLRFISGNPGLTVVLSNTLFFILGTINFYTIHFRTTALLPWDIFALKTAVNVMPGLKFYLPLRVVLALVYVVISAVIGFKIGFSFEKRKKQLPQTAGAVLLLIAFLVVTSLGRNGFWIDAWDQTKASRQNGLVLNLTLNMQILNNKAPEGFSEKKVSNILSGMVEPAETAYIKPNIIAIMNESFADLSVYGDLKSNEDIMPFVHNLSENTVKGQLIVPVFGGGTCNTEYEFLTGNTCAFLQAGSYPLQQYIHKETPSVASALKDLGYKTVAIHPYYPNGWGRQRAYPLLGFDRFLSLDDFEGYPLLRSLVSDKGSYQKIIEEYEAKSKDDRLFVFNVTMQNHCGYDTPYDNLKEDVSFADDAYFPQAKQYFALAKQSDKAISELVSYFKHQTEPTVILFFGDHQPPIEPEFYDKYLNISKLSDNEKAKLKHTVPFFIWANYDIDETNIGQISSNYLSPLLMQTAKLPLTPYQQYLSKLSLTMPVVSTSGCVDKTGKLISLDASSKALDDYKIIQYDAVFN